MPRNRDNPPLPVRLCRVCWATHNVHTAGVTSQELEEWYCCEGCRHVRRLRIGLLTQKDTPGVFNTVLQMMERHYSPELIRWRRKKVLQRFDAGKERPIAVVIDGLQAHE